METTRNVLIIDDNQDYVLAMKTFLSKNGFAVRSAPDGKKGIELIAEQAPDLILLDVMMESLYSGFDVCKYIRKDPRLKEIPIIGISGLKDELGITFDKERDSDYFSPDAFFDKPVDKDALLKTINDLLSS
ncbi:MAG: response regulator [Desulfovermiculus sp.]|nr:response regulator [Desulfovermiculus sp.]